MPGIPSRISPSMQAVEAAITAGRQFVASCRDLRQSDHANPSASQNAVICAATEMQWAFSPLNGGGPLTPTMDGIITFYQTGWPDDISGAISRVLSSLLKIADLLGWAQLLRGIPIQAHPNDLRRIDDATINGFSADVEKLAAAYKGWFWKVMDQPPVQNTKSTAAATPSPAKTPAAVDRPADVPGKGMAWQDARTAAEDHCARNPFPGVNALAKIVKCSTATIRKAIKRSAKLRAKLVEHEAHRTSISAAAMTEKVATSAKQTREADPIDAASASTDELFHRLMELAKPSERAALDAMTPAQRRDLVATCEHDPDAGYRVRGR